MSLRQCLRSTCCLRQGKFLQLSWQSRQNAYRRYSLYEPPYLNVKPEFPSYETLNIRMRGYDFAVLESYARYVHNLAKVFDLDSTASDGSSEVKHHQALLVTVHGYDADVHKGTLKSESTENIQNLKQIGRSDICSQSLFPVPARTSKIQSFKPQSSQLQHEYDLAVYKRTVQIDDLTSVAAPVFFEVLRLNMPAGVQLTVKETDPNEDDFRYVPDLTLRDLHAQIAELDKAKDDRKRK